MQVSDLLLIDMLELEECNLGESQNPYHFLQKDSRLDFAEKNFFRGFGISKRLETEPPRGRGIDQAVLHRGPKVAGGKRGFRTGIGSRHDGLQQTRGTPLHRGTCLQGSRKIRVLEV